MLKISIYDEPSWFEHFGLVTVGPIDGHDIPTLVEFLNEAKHFDRPMVLHVKTIKGKGYEFAEGDATTFHSPAAFKYDPDSCRVEIAKKGRSFTSAFGEAMIGVMGDPLVVGCTAAMPGGTGMDKVAEKFPDRTFDTGICESHAMDMLAGMAKSGVRPFFAVYSTFLQRVRPGVPGSRACRGSACGCASTGPGSSAATARCTTASATSPSSARCPMRC